MLPHPHIARLRCRVPVPVSVMGSGMVVPARLSRGSIRKGSVMTEPVAFRLPPLPGPVHFVGIGGAGMNGLARLLIEGGYRVSGSDRADSPALTELRTAGATVFVGHDAVQVRDAALVVITAAVGDENPEVASARARGIPVVKRAALLGVLANTKRLIAVAGTHGKSTTSGMIALALSRLGADPWYAVGASVRDLGTSASAGTGTVGVVEADEYDHSFLHLAPVVASVLNLEHDHPDLFPDMATYAGAFDQFAQRIVSGGVLLVNADEPACHALAVRHRARGGRVETVGYATDADWRLVADADTGADGMTVLSHDGAAVGPFVLQVPGEHNLRNAAVAVAACAAVGFDSAAVLHAVGGYSGVGRRFELVGEVGGVTVVDDYAHHPTEVRATIAAARGRYPGRRIVAVFQPHTFTRTRLYAEQFGAALGTADVALVSDIYPAREPDSGDIHATDVVKHIPDARGKYSNGMIETLVNVHSEVQPGDVVLVMGAGTITEIGPALVRTMRDRETAR